MSFVTFSGSLLKAISGRFNDNPNLKGNLLFNGRPYTNYKTENVHIPRLASFVDQGDVHMALLTVRETFQFALENSCPDINLLENDEIKALHSKKIDTIIGMLGLKECIF